MDKKKFIINLLSSVISALCSVVISFFITPYLIKTIGKEAYGFYPLAGSFIFYITIFTTSINSMFGRYVLISYEKKERDKINNYFNSVFFVNILISIILSILFFVFYTIIPNVIEIPNHLVFDVKILFLFIFLSLIINLVTSVFGAIGFIFNRLDINAIRNILGNFINITLILLLLYFCFPKIYFLGIGSLAMAVYVGISNFYITKKYLPDLKFSKSFISKNIIKVLFYAGVWNSVMSLSDALFYQADLFIVNTNLGVSEMGNLALTKQFPSLLLILSNIIIPVFIPTFVKFYANGEADELKKYIGICFKLSSLILLIPVAGIVIYSNIFYTLWTPTEDINKLSSLLILILLKYVIQLSIEPIFSIYITLNKIKIPALVTLGMSILNLALIFTLLKFTKLGIYAIPIAAMICTSLNHLIFSPLYVSKILNYKSIVIYKLIIQGLLVFCIALGVNYMIKVNTVEINKWSLFVIANVIGGLISLILGVFVVFKRSQLELLLLLVKNKINAGKE
ncbi:MULTISPECIES: oligosaccharide flippase family protein [unclassified Empedobacter]|uniref:oligosaccharide flippase family protein n=1 Tax=unclassified Empedobacter TaxID=2643773 RepID=UPI0025C02823|nr:MULTISPECIES: oligosaccharide flippase family protein [unclassified Empedobacter]